LVRVASSIIHNTTTTTTREKNKNWKFLKKLGAYQKNSEGRWRGGGALREFLSFLRQRQRRPQSVIQFLPRWRDESRARVCFVVFKFDQVFRVASGPCSLKLGARSKIKIEDTERECDAVVSVYLLYSYVLCVAVAATYIRYSNYEESWPGCMGGDSLLVFWYAFSSCCPRCWKVVVIPLQP
jgi:hypothetical protein